MAEIYNCKAHLTSDHFGGFACPLINKDVTLAAFGGHPNAKFKCRNLLCHDNKDKLVFPPKNTFLDFILRLFD